MRIARALCTTARPLLVLVKSGQNGEKYERKRFRKKRKKSKVRHGMVHRKQVYFSKDETI